MIFGSAEILAKLRAQYSPPNWAFFQEVKSEVGFGRTRIDGLAVAMWQSLGLEVRGFEVKVSRSDWLRELKNAAKSNGIFKFCDRWSLVVANDEIVKDGELPPNWGLIVQRKEKLKTVVHAPKLEPQQWTRLFMAELIRHTFNMPASDKERGEYQRGLADGRNMVPIDPDTVRKVSELETLKRRLEEFETHSGLKIEQYTNTRQMGEAVKLFMNTQSVARYRQEMLELNTEAQRISQRIYEAFMGQENLNFGQVKTE